jgi:hypothetical protein
MKSSCGLYSGTSSRMPTERSTDARTLPRAFECVANDIEYTNNFLLSHLGAEKTYSTVPWSFEPRSLIIYLPALPVRACGALFTCLNFLLKDTPTARARNIQRSYKFGK